MKEIAIVIFDITNCAGTERAVCNLANLLVKSQKYSVSIISVYSFMGEASYNLIDGVNIFHLGLPFCRNKIQRLFLINPLLMNIKRICNKKKIDIILGTTVSINIILYYLKKTRKIIACEHMNYMAASLSSRIMRRIIYPLLDFTVVLTQSDAKRYSYLKNIIIIPNSLSFLSLKKSELRNKKILAIGRLTYQKGFDLLIKAISLIKTECKEWKVKIIGSGKDKKKLVNQIKHLKLENIIKLYPPTDNIIQEYLNADFYVLSSRFEGFPFVMIEAQSCGLPIVSFNCPEGPSEIVHHNEDGLLVENGNVIKLSLAILELMNDWEKKKQFSIAALRNAEKYSPENIFSLWENLIDNL